MLTRPGNKKIPILMYHSISDSAKRGFKQFTVSPTLFAQQMGYLHQHAYTPITVTHLVRALFQGETGLPERPVVLTFDDGFADFFTEVLPLLKQYGFVATLYISTAFVNGTSSWLKHEEERTRPMLTRDQLGEISASGIECGAHSHSHPQLDTLSYLIAQEEIVLSKSLLEGYLKQEILSFAYPYGYHTARVRQLVREAGYTSACAVKHTMSSERDDPFSLARLMVSTDSHLDAFAALLTGRNLSLATATYKIYARIRTPVWQLARRCSASVVPPLQGRRIVR